MLGIVQDISNDEMQRLWGYILSNEFRKPGLFSLRTLDSVRNISQAEAQIFEKLAGLMFDSEPYEDQSFERSYGADTCAAGVLCPGIMRDLRKHLHQNEIERLVDAGFLVTNQLRRGYLPPPTEDRTLQVRIGGHRFRIVIAEGLSRAPVDYLPITQAARELSMVELLIFRKDI